MIWLTMRRVMPLCSDPESRGLPADILGVSLSNSVSVSRWSLEAAASISPIQLPWSSMKPGGSTSLENRCKQ